MIDKTPLILASASPRRSQLLASAGVAFEVIVSDVVEKAREDERPREFARRIAREKAEQVAASRPQTDAPRPVLAADTIVVVDGRTLGKPKDRQDAQQMLRALSGRTHQVVTAFCLIVADHIDVQATETDVTFTKLSDDEIERYLDVARWQDKAGAYAVQEHAARMVSSISGSYTNVVGLPLCETMQLLRHRGVI